MVAGHSSAAIATTRTWARRGCTRGRVLSGARREPNSPAPARLVRASSASAWRCPPTGTRPRSVGGLTVRKRGLRGCSLDLRACGPRRATSLSAWGRTGQGRSGGASPCPETGTRLRSAVPTTVSLGGGLGLSRARWVRGRSRAANWSAAARPALGALVTRSHCRVVATRSSLAVLPTTRASARLGPSRGPGRHGSSRAASWAPPTNLGLDSSVSAWRCRLTAARR